jgi:transcriptional regulator with XRE-family HTH domain
VHNKNIAEQNKLRKDIYGRRNVVEPNKPLIDKYEEIYAKDPDFIAGGLALKVTEEMLKILHERNQSQSWLAEKMGVSRARISRILNARPNMTLFTIAQIAIALDVKPDISLLELQPTNVGFSSATQSEPLIDEQNILETVEPIFKPNVLNASFEPATYQMVTA